MSGRALPPARLLAVVAPGNALAIIDTGRLVGIAIDRDLVYWGLATSALVSALHANAG